MLPPVDGSFALPAEYSHGFLYNLSMIVKSVRKYKMGEEERDCIFWRSRPPEERLAALESIRSEFNSWKYSDAEQRFQRVFAPVRRETR
jgi:hypothetical protein